MPRIRLSSLEPIELTPDLLKLFTNKRMCPHFHLSIQSFNTEVLKQMKRKYKKEDVLECLQAIQSYLPQAFVGMDLIAGFPSESQAQFEDTYESLCNSPWTRIHVFPYSERKGTWASRNLLDQVTEPQRRKRAKQLRALSKERYEQVALQQIGSRKQVLLLQNKKGRQEKREILYQQGLSRDYWSVQIPLSSVKPAKRKGEMTLQIESVFQDKAMNKHLLGRPLF